MPTNDLHECTVFDCYVCKATTHETERMQALLQAIVGKPLCYVCGIVYANHNRGAKVQK